MSWLDGVRFDDRGLVPVVVVEEWSNEVLMLAYANAEALDLTRSTGQAWYWSRERRRLWRKGETSGNTQEVRGMTFDCDRDAILYRVVQKGNACHEGDHSCFHNPVAFSEGHAVSAVGAGGRGDILDRLTRIIEQRKREMPEGSYVSSLFRAGRSRVAQKVGEEAAEVMVAFLSEGRERAISESADLLFHLMVALASAGASLDDVRAELEKRER